MVSAFIKSMRASDPDAAVYWMARMLEAGEDPMFLFRRLTVIAAEDIGNADPHALPLVVAAREAFRQLGEPEGKEKPKRSSLPKGTEIEDVDPLGDERVDVERVDETMEGTSVEGMDEMEMDAEMTPEPMDDGGLADGGM